MKKLIYKYTGFSTKVGDLRYWESCGPRNMEKNQCMSQQKENTVNYFKVSKIA